MPDSTKSLRESRIQKGLYVSFYNTERATSSTCRETFASNVSYHCGLNSKAPPLHLAMKFGFYKPSFNFLNLNLSSTSELIIQIVKNMDILVGNTAVLLYPTALKDVSFSPGTYKVIDSNNVLVYKGVPSNVFCFDSIHMTLFMGLGRLASKIAAWGESDKLLEGISEEDITNAMLNKDKELAAENIKLLFRNIKESLRLTGHGANPVGISHLKTIHNLAKQNENIKLIDIPRRWQRVNLLFHSWSSLTRGAACNYENLISKEDTSFNTLGYYISRAEVREAV